MLQFFWIVWLSISALVIGCAEHATVPPMANNLTLTTPVPDNHPSEVATPMPQYAKEEPKAQSQQIASQEPVPITKDSAKTLVAVKAAPIPVKPVLHAQPKSQSLPDMQPTLLMTSAQTQQPIIINTTEAEKEYPLSPFKAVFRIYFSKLPTTIKAELSLMPANQPDTWVMRFSTDSLLIKNIEESQFVWNNCHPKSMRYHHKLDGFGNHRQNDTTFSWQPPIATTVSDNQRQQLAIPENAIDDLTLLLQASCVFQQNQTDYRAVSIYATRIKNNHFVLSGKEKLKTAMGELDTLVIEKVYGENSKRRTLFWIAPSLNYMLVKAKHVESALLYGEVILMDFHVEK